MTTLISLCPGLKTALDKGNFKQKSTLIRHDHPVMVEHLPVLEAVAEALGVYFKWTRFTFSVSIKDDGRRNYYGLVVSLIDGVPSLVWGHTATPLADLKLEPVVTGSDEASLEFDLPDEVTLTVPMTLEGKPTSTDLRKALKGGVDGLKPFLKEGFIKPVAVADLPVGAYVVTSYSKTQGYQGACGYVLQVLGVGPVKANSALARKLEAEPQIDADSPAILKVGDVTSYHKGHPIVPTSLVTKSDEAVPVYDFD